VGDYGGGRGGRRDSWSAWWSWSWLNVPGGEGDVRTNSAVFSPPPGRATPAAKTTAARRARRWRPDRAALMEEQSSSASAFRPLSASASREETRRIIDAAGSVAGSGSGSSSSVSGIGCSHGTSFASVNDAQTSGATTGDRRGMDGPRRVGHRALVRRRTYRRPGSWCGCVGLAFAHRRAAHVPSRSGSWSRWTVAGRYRSPDKLVLVARIRPRRSTGMRCTQRLAGRSWSVRS